ncbi:FDLD family class I lanthipeptide [Streptomyces sp. IBSNAI002]|uniref:FDLD family class I lanthipeptide n=1 Tax=Streptomyces sp. IBSNAI002 TaxID=3457500 RepID=UPI003FD35E3A
MAVTQAAPAVQEFDLDEFDLDVRIAVSSDIASIEGGFSNWYSCKGTCGSYCGCDKPTIISCIC